MFRGARKEDLRVIAEQIGEEFTEEMKVTDLRNLILNSESYKNDKEFVESFADSVVEERKLKEERQAQTKLELEKIKLNAENQLQIEKMKLEIAKLENSRGNTEGIHQFSEAMNHTSIETFIHSVRTLTLPVPKRAEGWNLFFSSLERAFKTKNVPEEYKGEILLNMLGEKAVNILVYIKDEEINNYEKIKDTVLREYEPTPLACLQNFQKAKRMANETHVQYASRLATSWEQYCKVRDVNDFDSLKELIISDKLFQSLDQETATHINIKQEEKWFRPLHLAKECDMFFSSKGRSFSEMYYSNPHKSSFRETNAQNQNKYIPPHLRRKETKSGQNQWKESKKIECYICGENHRARFCKNKYYPETESGEKKDNERSVVATITSQYFKPDVYMRPLKYASIFVGGKEIECILDSGTQLMVVNSKLLPEMSNQEHGTIVLSSAFGERVKAKLVKARITLRKDALLNHPLECVIALTDKLSSQALIPPSIYENLCLINDESTEKGSEENFNSQSGKESTNAIALGPEVNVPNPGEEENQSDCLFLAEEKDDLDDSNFHSDHLKLKEEQNKCESLEKVREELKHNKGNFVLIDGLIYHKDKIMGEPVTQLVLPRCRIDKVLKLAHESVFGGHMGLRKTKERIRYNFYWPNMSGEIAEFVQTCMGCQLRKKEKVSDRAPITPVMRPELPFEVVNIDVIGPIEPSSSRGHKYVLCMMDQHTRWPEAVPLRSLSAKSTCDALLQIFSRTGIPNIVASDQGTNFKSSLTQEFLKRIGSSPRFSCPGYPASNGLVERWNRVLKDMLHHAIRKDPRSWDKQLPFLLFAYREVPNTTTGISPFKLLYGREARGPLSVLKSSWAGDIHLPTKVSQSAADYLQEMKIRMEKAAENASLTAAQKQKSYSDYFNKRSSVRNFQIGEQVVLLIPDSSNKIYARWTGPGEIIQHLPPHSYKVKLSDGTVKHVHVNKIRKYHPRSLAVGVIFEEEQEFGDVHPTPSLSKIAPDIYLECLELSHLSKEDRKSLLELIRKHKVLFTNNLRIAKVGAHRIQLKPNAERKKPFVYRIPESLKAKVDEQIGELLSLGLIEESSAEIAYPIVCVNKKDGGMRLCVDYRALNLVTIADDFPMEDATELIHSIGRANIISTLDLLKGYWAIPMADDSKDLTSFKTHRQQYRFKVMSFGLKNASATFQREMNKVLSPFRDFSRAYIDDIAVFSKDWKEHLLHLDMIMTKLAELNFTVNLKKCSFAKSHIKYLGHIIGSGRHQPDPEKTKAVEDLSRPKTKKELRSVLGLCNYYRDYIPSYSELVYPLTELTKKRVPDLIPWTEKHDSTFNHLKRALVEAPSLYSPVPGKPFIIHSDASQIGIAACLAQKSCHKVYPIAYASQKLSKTQQSWSTIEREAFAIVWSLKKFEVWIFGTEIEFYTDHNPLPYLTKSAPQSSRLQRWAFALQKYNITIKHCPGAKMPHADALSRLV